VNNMLLFLGIDTSCYTTSVAVVNSQKQLIKEHRQLLHVPLAQKGLQQSSAVFQHVQILPALLEKVLTELNPQDLKAVICSTKPRPYEKSYMPVFTVGAGFGRVLANSLRIPFLTTSHQEGHLMAGIWSSGAELPEKFLAVHLSGGTSELLLIKRAYHKESFFEEKLLGGTTDLHAGQLVDRIGVALGLPFPAGPYLENLARQSSRSLTIPSSVNKYDFSFSGAETRLKKYLADKVAPGEIANAVENCIAKTVEKVVRRAVEEYKIQDVLIVGGVAKNEYIRSRLKTRLEHPAVGARLFFAESKFSSDNAVGVALLGTYLQKNQI